MSIDLVSYSINMSMAYPRAYHNKFFLHSCMDSWSLDTRGWQANKKGPPNFFSRILNLHFFNDVTFKHFSFFEQLFVVADIKIP